jgi:hypothetical protein
MRSPIQGFPEGDNFHFPDRWPSCGWLLRWKVPGIRQPFKPSDWSVPQDMDKGNLTRELEDIAADKRDITAHFAKQARELLEHPDPSREAREKLCVKYREYAPEAVAWWVKKNQKVYKAVLETNPDGWCGPYEYAREASHG